MNPAQKEPVKTCSCGLEHFTIPHDAKENASGDIQSGFYWNCFCGSTLFVYDPLCDEEDTCDDADTREREEEEDMEDEKDREFEFKKSQGII